MARLRRPLALLATLLVSGGLAACGKHLDEEARVVHVEMEGLYLPVGEMKYQVQASRQLNPSDRQDLRFLTGIPPRDRELRSDQVWFAVFLRVENESKRPLPPSGEIEIHDTQDNVYEPIDLEPSNAFAYRTTIAIPPGSVLPLPDTPAFGTAAQGAMLLFKLRVQALDNRPLELIIENEHGPPQTGIIDLDV